MNQYAVDLTNCDREPIHVPGSVQPFGFMLALLSDFSVCIASENVGKFLGRDIGEVLQQPIDDLLPAPAVKAIRSRVDYLAGPEAVERMFGVQLQPGGPPFDIAIHFAGAYLGARADRIALGGPDVALDPKAFATLALVVHEMMTNSAKYGALADSTGQVEVAWKLDQSSSLVIEWKESGGPPVQPPSRRGFGTTIIERSIPLDLNGDAELSFGLLDVEARFVTPANYVQLMTTSTRERMKAKEEISPPRLSGTALIVEDNLIIAMSAEVILLELGARHAETATSVSEAMKAIERAKPSFALLDLNLGSKNSIAVGRKLKELKVPFIFATGYGERAPIPAELSDAPVIQKLYTRSLIESTLGKLKLG